MCTAKFSQNGHLKVHISSIHEGNKPSKCDICTKKYTRNENLKSHIASIHEENR